MAWMLLCYVMEVKSLVEEAILALGKLVSVQLAAGSKFS